MMTGDYNYKMLTTPDQFATNSKNQHWYKLPEDNGRYVFFSFQNLQLCGGGGRVEMCCHLPALSVTFAFMIERCEPVGDLLTNTAQQRLRKARSELCFIGETRVSHGIVYCTHVHSPGSAWVARGLTLLHMQRPQRRIFSLVLLPAQGRTILQVGSGSNFMSSNIFKIEPNQTFDVTHSDIDT